MTTYILSITISGALFGFLFTLIIYVFSYPLTQNIKSVLLGIIIILYIVKDFGVATIKIPQRRWQIPDHWVSHENVHKNMMVWGGILGGGIFTYIPHASFYILYLYSGFFLNPIYGLALGALYGFSRTLPIIIMRILYFLIGQNSLELAISKRLEVLNRAINISALAISMFILVHQF